MRKSFIKTLRHEFVNFIPEQVEEGVLYISLQYRTAIHKCACGCGEEVVTPISPSGWELRFNGESVSLFPSIGNWSYACQSHYWIRKGKVKVARKWSDFEIQYSRLTEKGGVKGKYDPLDVTPSKSE